MFYATLNKVESTHNNLRTNTVNGLVPELPEVGGRLFMYSSEVLTPNTNMRHIYTSIIQEIKVDEATGDMTIRTENSLYMLTNIRLAEGGKPTVGNSE
jgi:hypothetical protein